MKKQGDLYLKIVSIVLAGIVVAYLVLSVLFGSGGSSYTLETAVRCEAGDGQTVSGFVVREEEIITASQPVVVCALLIAFLGTRMGLSIRATGDNPDMVRASSINTAFTITVGLCIANAMTALSGAVLAQYQRSADINLGTGMVVIGLASLIIGETLFGRGGMWVKAVAAVIGRGRRRGQRHLPLHYCAGSACQRPVGVPEADLRRHRRAGHCSPGPQGQG